MLILLIKSLKNSLIWIKIKVLIKNIKKYIKNINILLDKL